jgi:hypothetical protein
MAVVDSAGNLISQASLIVRAVGAPLHGRPGAFG